MSSIALRTTIPTDEGGSRFIKEDIPLKNDTVYGLRTDP